MIVCSINGWFGMWLGNARKNKRVRYILRWITSSYVMGMACTECGLLTLKWIEEDRRLLTWTSVARVLGFVVKREVTRGRRSEVARGRCIVCSSRWCDHWEYAVGCNDAHVEVDCLWCNIWYGCFCLLHDSHTKPKEEMVIQVRFTEVERCSGSWG